MKISTLLFVLCALVAAQVGLSFPSYAIDLTGAWATDAKGCGKMFTKAGKSISFKRNSDMFGGGFIAEANVIRGRMAKCSIKTRKEDGAVTHIIAQCSSDIMVGQMQLSFKAVDDNSIIRQFPGMEGMEISYSRCSL
jgi:hypothetical protein